jgi:uncharacterized DUF497 family protein
MAKTPYRSYDRQVAGVRFDWDANKDRDNQEKHGASFAEAQRAFADIRRVIAEDVSHSQREKRFYCFGRVDRRVLTVRFTYRAEVIRIIGAGYWRKGRRMYEQENRIHGRAPRKAPGRS